MQAQTMEKLCAVCNLQQIHKLKGGSNYQLGHETWSALESSVQGFLRAANLFSISSMLELLASSVVFPAILPLGAADN